MLNQDMDANTCLYIKGESEKRLRKRTVLWCNKAD